ncbi:MAG: YceI family protein [Steroidobacterales bacterium]
MMLPRKWPSYALATLCMFCASCTGVRAPPPLQPVVPGVAPPGGRAAGAVDYHVDAAHSELRVLVYRGGPLAALGHNHVIVDAAIQGWVRSGQTLQDSAFYLQLAPADFLVDPPSARAQEGADFADDVTDEARAGTRRNMLGAAQLDVERFPLILIQSDSVQGAGPAAATATFRITIAGRTRLATVPFTFERHPGVLHLRADFRLRQSELGLEPLSVLLGRLRAEDEMHLKLDVVAVADQAVALD